MEKITKTYLTFEEELLVAVYHNNVEKLKWLIGMDYFKPSMVTEPIDFGEVSVPLYWITLCYRYMLRYGEYDNARKPVDEILTIWSEIFHLDTDEIVDLKSCYHADKMPPVIKDEDKWWMGHLTLEDFLRSGAREIDFKLYKAINAYNVKEIVFYLKEGAAPDAKVIDKGGKALSAISMLRCWKRNRDYYLWGEEHVVEEWKIRSLVSNGLEEMILFLLEKNITNRKGCPVETYDGEWNLYEDTFDSQLTVSPAMKEEIGSFVKEIDKPGAVLVMFDEGKAFVRARHLHYQSLYTYVIKSIFKETKHVIIRVGGYSYRVAQLVLDLIKQQPHDRLYVEYLSEGSAEDEWKDRDSRIRVIGMGRYQFRPDMDIVKLANEYDFKTFGYKNGTHTMVYYYVNNIDTGWYEEDGKFCPFYNKYRGLQAITDVVMINGYDEIVPATSVVCTFTFDSGGDIILAGGTIHKDRRSRTSSQKKLIENSCVCLLDLTNKEYVSKQ